MRRVSISNAGSRTARHRDHLLLRTRARPAERRCRASRLREAVRRDRISRRHRRDPRDPTAAHARRARDLGRASQRRRRRGRRRAGVRDRPGALPRPRTGRQRADRDARRAAADQLGRRRARSDFRAAPPRAHRAGRDGPHRLLDDGGGDRAPRCSTASTSTTTPRPMSGRRRSPGRRRRCSFIISASTPARPRLFQRLAGHVIFAGPTLAALLRHHPPGLGPAVRALGSGHFRRSADRAAAHRRHRDISISRARLLQAHEYWRMKQLAVDLVILNERESSYVQDLQVALETLVRASQSRPRPGAALRRAASSFCAAI